MKSISIPIHESKFVPYYASTIKDLVDVNKIMDFLRAEYIKQGRPNITFKQFAKPILERKLYNLLIYFRNFKIFFFFQNIFL